LGFDRFAANQIVFDYVIVMPTLKGSSYAEEVERAFAMAGANTRW
jgi:hypothetical protein